jgi:hypothetical protein
MGALIRAMDWSKTPIGPVESWRPTFFINGMRYDGARALNALLDAVTLR